MLTVAGDKINVTGVLATTDSEMANNSNRECYFAFGKSKIELASNTAVPANGSATATKSATESKSTRTSKKK